MNTSLDSATNAASASEHGLASGDAARPASADWTIDQDWASYTEQEHHIWKTLFERQQALLPGRACRAFLQGMQALPMAADRIPDFESLSKVLIRKTGWQVVAVPGLVPDEVFFRHLSERRFPAGRFIRRPHELDYLQEPDVFHDVFGHLPMLMNPVMADFIQAYGFGGLKAAQMGFLPMLARVYWYTVEFGLVKDPDGLRIYGAGIASSRTESVFCLDDPSPHRFAFHLERVMRTLYRIDAFQECYFVLDHLDALLQLAHIDFEPLYRLASRLPTLQASDVLPTDSVISQKV